MAFENLKSTGIAYLLTRLKEYFLQIKDAVKSVNGNLPDGTGNITIDSVPYAQNLETSISHRDYSAFILRTAGGDNSLGDGEAWLMDVKGNNVHENYVPESIEMTVNQAEGSNIEATIDRDTFVEYVQASGTYTIVYTSSWSIDPALYGITVEGNPVAGDSITVVYVAEERGTITVTTPAKLISTGWNLYNHTKTYAKVVKYAYGYMVSGTYTGLQYSATEIGTKSDITVTDGSFDIPADGYVWVSGGNSSDTAIWATWEDWTEEYDGEFSAYSQTEIDLTGMIGDDIFPYGLLKAGTVVDEINLNLGQAIQRVERLDYDAENLATAKASGREYEYDQDYIYLALATPVTTSVIINGSYTASDHGIEYFTDTAIPVQTEILYGNNLKNKLERNVLTISQQSLTESQISQVLKNLDASAVQKQVGEITSGSWNDFTKPQIFWYTDANASSFTNAPSATNGYTGIVYNADGRITQVAVNNNTIRYRYYTSSWTSWRSFKPIWVKTVTATTSANGNLTAGLSRSTYVVISANVNGADRIAIPTAYNSSNWGAHICSTYESMSAITNTEVTVSFYYTRIDDIGS